MTDEQLDYAEQVIESIEPLVRGYFEEKDVAALRALLDDYKRLRTQARRSRKGDYDAATGEEL